MTIVTSCILSLNLWLGSLGNKVVCFFHDVDAQKGAFSVAAKLKARSDSAYYANRDRESHAFGEGGYVK